MIEDFSRIIDLGTFLQQDLSDFTPENVQKLHVAVAKEVKSAEISSNGIPASQVQTIVDGRTPAVEEQVKPFGNITYQFGSLAAIALECRDLLVNASPKESGRYKDSWFPMINGVVTTWGALEQELKPGDEIWISNDQPYSRLLNVGFDLHLKVGHHIVDDVKDVANRRFGNSVRVSVEFIDLNEPGSGLASEVPWILRNSQGNKKDRKAGSAVTYPTLILRPR